MSKMDNLRAMREAKYDANAKRTASTKAATAPARAAPVAPPETPPAPTAAAPVETAAGEDPDLCGHRNMSGRTCTRERGHAAKSHRYS